MKPIGAICTWCGAEAETVKSFEHNAGCLMGGLTKLEDALTIEQKERQMLEKRVDAAIDLMNKWLMKLSTPPEGVVWDELPVVTKRKLINEKEFVANAKKITYGEDEAVRERLIKKIEKLKHKDEQEDWDTGFNQGIESAITIIEKFSLTGEDSVRG